MLCLVLLGLSVARGVDYYGYWYDPALGDMWGAGTVGYHYQTGTWYGILLWDGNRGEGWLYDFGHGWVWTNRWAVPWVYSDTYNVWMYYDSGTYPYRWFWVSGFGWVRL